MLLMELCLVYQGDQLQVIHLNYDDLKPYFDRRILRGHGVVACANLPNQLIANEIFIINHCFYDINIHASTHTAQRRATPPTIQRADCS